LFKVALLFPIKYLINKYFKELAYTNASNKGICDEFCRKQQHNLGLPTFKLPASTNIIDLTR